jgi:tRNA modification GTPase
LRQTESIAEQEGIRRAQAAVQNADIVLWIASPEDRSPLPAIDNMIAVASKADLYDAETRESAFDISVSAKTGFAMDKLEKMIKERLKTDITDCSLDLITDRQYDQAQEAVREFENALSTSTLDVAAFYITRGLNRIKALEGKDISETALDALFSKFCIGK